LKVREPRPESDIPLFLDYLQRLVHLAEEIKSSPIRIDGADHLAFMALSFLLLQLKHAKSIKLLIDNRLYEDAGQIARSSLEAMCYLLWACKEPSEERPLKWRSFVYIEAFREIKDKIKNGLPVEATYKAWIDEGLSNFGSIHFTNKAKEAQRNSKPLPNDPYVYKWHGKNIKEIFEEIKAIPLYGVSYNQLSQWVHSDPFCLSKLIGLDGTRIIDRSGSLLTAGLALVTGVHALVKTLEVYNAHLQLGFSDALRDFLAETYEAVKA